MEDHEKQRENFLSQPKPHPKKLKYLTTIAILFGNITFGTALNFFSPALEDLRIKYDTTIEEISLIFTIVLVSYCVGALSCGVIYKFLNRQLGVIICTAIASLCLFVIPHSETKTSFFIIGSILGFFIGIYDTSQIVWIVEIWQEKAGPFIQAQHFFYALGLNIPPLLFGAFPLELSSSEGVVSKIRFLFSIGGAFSSTSCAFQLFLFIFFRYYAPPMYGGVSGFEDDNGMRENQKNGFWKIITSPRMKLIIVTGVFIGAYVGMEMSAMQFIPTFGQTSNLKLSESEAALVTTGLTGSFTLFRFFGIFIIMKVHPLLMLSGSLVLVLIGNCILLLWANDNLTMFWIACITLGTGYSTQFASFSAFMEKNLIFTDGIGSYMVVCGSLVAAIYPLIIGKSIEENAMVLTYPIFFSLGAAFLALVVGWWITRGKNRRY